MNGKKWKDIFEKLAGKLRFLKPDDESEPDDLQIEEKPLSSGKTAPEDDLRTLLALRRRKKFWARLFGLILVVGIAGAFAAYNSFHTFSDYTIAGSYENEVAGGTQYVPLGKYICRYNADGVSCVTRKNVLNWSITYNMQAPIADVCKDTLVIAEQQGTQVYVVNKDGLVGNFETLLPILDVRVSNQGVVAVVLWEDEVTWVNLYEPDGASIVSDKTTITGSGYPLGIDLSPDGQKLAVSYLSVEGGIVTSSVVFYHFGEAGKPEDNYIVSSVSYQDTVIPEIYFTDNSRAVAVSDSGYIVFQGSDAPKETVSVTFDEEIVSVFHDENAIGFLFDSSQEGYAYRLELYSYRGRKKTAKDINAAFDKIKMENGQIILYNSNGCSVYTVSGRERFTSAYEKEISEIFYFSEFRKYLVITPDSFDRIRIR